MSEPKKTMKDFDEPVEIQPGQSAVVFEENGDMNLYFPKPKNPDDPEEEVNQGAMQMLLVSVFLGNTPMGRLMRQIAKNEIKEKQAKLDAEREAEEDKEDVS